MFELYRQKMDKMLQMSAEIRRWYLAYTLDSTGSFSFDVNIVCSTFPIKAFRFSRDLQCYIRVNVTDTLTPRKHSELQDADGPSEEE